MYLLLAALIALPTALFATNLPSLRLSGGARATGLSEAVAALSDAQALNPATLQTSGRSISFSHGAWIQSISQDYLHLSWNRGQSVWGISGQLWQTDNLERRTGPSTEPLGYFGVYESTAGLSYARAINKIRLGMRLKFIHQSISDASASGGAADFGLAYDLANHLRLGATLLNLGTMNHLNHQKTDLPLDLRFGGAAILREILLISVEAQKVRGTDLTLHLGSEYRVGKRVRVRGGYQSAENRNLSTGLGLKTGRWIIDYAYVPFGSGLGHTHRLSLQLESPTH